MYTDFRCGVPDRPWDRSGVSRRRMDESPFTPLGLGTLVLQTGITRFQSYVIKTRKP
jgi:hypothetical protein